MSKQYNIKWRDKDVKELNRIVRNFNAKVNRLARDKPETSQYLPEKMSVKELRQGIVTRQDFNRKINSLQRFSRRGAEELVTTKTGVTLPKYQVSEARILSRIVEGKKTVQRKKLALAEEKGVGQQVSAQNLRPKPFSIDKQPKDLEKYIAGLEKKVLSGKRQEDLKKYKKDYLEAITNFLGEDGEELYELVSGIEDLEMLFSESVGDPVLNIGFTSDPLPTRDIAEASLSRWREKI